MRTLLRHLLLHDRIIYIVAFTAVIFSRNQINPTKRLLTRKSLHVFFDALQMAWII